MKLYYILHFLSPCYEFIDAIKVMVKVISISHDYYQLLDQGEIRIPTFLLAVTCYNKGSNQQTNELLTKNHILELSMILILVVLASVSNLFHGKDCHINIFVFFQKFKDDNTMKYVDLHNFAFRCRSWGYLG